LDSDLPQATVKVNSPMSTPSEQIRKIATQKSGQRVMYSMFDGQEEQAYFVDIMSDIASPPQSLIGPLAEGGTVWWVSFFRNDDEIIVWCEKNFEDTPELFYIPVDNGTPLAPLPLHEPLKEGQRITGIRFIK